jgi:hypothetical protein
MGMVAIKAVKVYVSFMLMIVGFGGVLELHLVGLLLL